NGALLWSQTYDIGTIPGFPFADSGRTCLETVTDIQPLDNGNLRVAATLQARVLTQNGPRLFDGVWLFELSPGGTIVWEDRRFGAGNDASYLPGNGWLLWSKLVPLGNGLTFAVSTGFVLTTTLGLSHYDPLTEVLVLDASGGIIARTTHNIATVDADAWSLTGAAGLPGGVLLGITGSPGDFDEWEAIELDAVGNEVSSWQIAGNYEDMSIAANASQGNVGLPGLFFWVAKGPWIEAYNPGGAQILADTTGSPILNLAYEPSQDLIQITQSDAVQFLSRNLTQVHARNMPSTVGAWSSPGTLVLDNGQQLTKIDTDASILGTVVRETDELVGEVGLDCIQKPTGEFVLTGRLPYNPANPQDKTWHTWIMELDANGSVLWQNSAPSDSQVDYFAAPVAFNGQDLVAGLGGDRAANIQGVGTLVGASNLLGRDVQAIAPTDQGQFLVSAWSSPQGDPLTNRVELSLLQPDLSTVWSSVITLPTVGLFGGLVIYPPQSIVPLEDSHLVGLALIDQFRSVVGISQVDSNGAHQGSWIYQLPGNDVNGPALIAKSAGGGFVLATTVAPMISNNGFPGLGATNGLLIGLDANFQPDWYTIYGGLESDRLFSLVALEDGFLLAGNSLSLGERSDAWLLRTDLDGNIVEGCAAVIEQGDWPQSAIFESLAATTAPSAPTIGAALPAEVGVFHPPNVIIDTTVARQCSGTADPVDPGTVGPPPPGTFTLTIILPGGGTGSVVSTPAGIDCGVQCQMNFPAGSTVVLEPFLTGGSVFSHWTGVDVDLGVEGAQVIMNANRTVEAWIE
ncbi:MAG: hypothetical protein P1V35_10105, partial [Planctomycetota bacterium]|nr:hypothetical protein [Planctomycetota bacterium]